MEANLLTLLMHIGVYTSEKNEDNSSSTLVRQVVQEQAGQIHQLTQVLCGTQASVFLEHDESATASPHAAAGPTVAALVSSVACWPLRTPSYAALTCALHQYAPTEHQVATRCVAYASLHLARDLNLVFSPESGQDDTDEQVIVSAWLRARLLLRYFCLLQRLGLIQEDSLMDLLRRLVDLATRAAAHDRRDVIIVVALLVLSTVPFLPNDSRGVLVDPLTRLLQGGESSTAYQSPYSPGWGSRALLLQTEPAEDVVGTDMEDDEDDEDDDDHDASGTVCDSLQDLVRAVTSTATTTRWALLQDAPWVAIPMPDATVPGAPLPLRYTAEPVPLVVPTTALTAEISALRPHLNWAGSLVLGRLPIFGPAPEEVDDEEDDDDDDDDTKSPQLQAYQRHFSLLDRYYLAEAVRDCILAGPVWVDGTGLEYGDIKTTAEQIWSLQWTLGPLSNDDDSPSHAGVEYALVETLLSLILQSSSGVGALRLVHLSRILLELVRLQPNVVLPAVVAAVATLVQDYLPSLTPRARENLSAWLAFHLSHTNYQWPAAYWTHWASFVNFGWNNSRGVFVKRTLAILTESLSRPDVLLVDCLPPDSPLVHHVLAAPPKLSDELASDQREALNNMDRALADRIYTTATKEDAASLLAYVTADSFVAAALANVTSDSMDLQWLRSGCLVRAMLSPSTQEYQVLQRVVQQQASEAMEDDPELTVPDVLSGVAETLQRYRSVLQAALAQDAAAGADSIPGQVYLLQLVADATFYSRVTFYACVQALIQHGVIQPASVVQWLLRDDGEPGARQGWWELAIMAITGGLAMEAIGSDNDQLAGYLHGMLSELVRRAVRLIDSLNAGAKTKKPWPAQVDLVEGVKYVVGHCHGLWRERVPGPVAPSISGPSLATLCSEVDDSFAIIWLRKSLERM
jgi:MIF4G like